MADVDVPGCVRGDRCRIFPNPDRADEKGESDDAGGGAEGEGVRRQKRYRRDIFFLLR